jgi:hypothetical protein
MIGSKVLDDNEGNAGICRHGFEKPFKGLQSPRRCAQRRDYEFVFSLIAHLDLSRRRSATAWLTRSNPALPWRFQRTLPEQVFDSAPAFLVQFRERFATQSSSNKRREFDTRACFLIRRDERTDVLARGAKASFTQSHFDELLHCFR